MGRAKGENNSMNEKPQISEVERRFHWSRLLDLYGGLLPPKQRQFMQLHFNEDLSLSEIAQSHEVSRQAVHDAICKGKKNLQQYEDHLALMQNEIDDAETRWMPEAMALIGKIELALGETPLYDNSEVLADLRSLSSLLRKQAKD